MLENIPNFKLIRSAVQVKKTAAQSAQNHAGIPFIFFVIRNRKKNTDIVKDLLGIKNKNALKRKVESLKKAGQRMAKKEGQLSG